eukprot:Skav216968  [mRNA]  locus=scaffold2531:230799:231776:+ [translate_table: standard]
MIEVTLRSLNGDEIDTLLVNGLSTVGTLKIRVRESCKQGFLQLVTGSGQVLTNSAETLEAAGIQNGDFLTVVFGQKAYIAATDGAFAVWCSGKVVAWGCSASGGDSSAVQHMLLHVEQVVATRGAFAALLRSGSVVTWGDSNYGGDSSAVQGSLKDVKKVVATRGAFAAILRSGSVVTWGDRNCGGDSSRVQDMLKDVQDIEVADGAFVASKATGCMVTWGVQGHESQNDQRRIATDKLREMRQVYATPHGLACRLADGSDIVWSDHKNVGISTALPDRLPRNVQHLAVTAGAYAAILDGEVVVAWGDRRLGGDNSSVRDELCYL